MPFPVRSPHPELPEDFLRNLFAFFDLKPRFTAPEHPVPLPAPIQREVRMEGITFTYAGKKTPALTDISLTLHKAEVIALVGENGAGKSTLIKLFCQLYATDSGTITVDGEDKILLWRDAQPCKNR